MCSRGEIHVRDAAAETYIICLGGDMEDVCGTHIGCVWEKTCTDLRICIRRHLYIFLQRTEICVTDVCLFVVVLSPSNI